MTLFTAFIITMGCMLAYLAGSIPFGLLLGKIFGAGDIRRIGSGNIGATNMLRTGRKGLAAFTLALDFTKGIVGIGMAQGFCHYFLNHPVHSPESYFISYLAAIAAVIGHVFPMWLKFKGGKGVATTFGVFFATQPLIGLLTVLGWILIFYLTRTSSLAAIGSIACAPILGFNYAGSGFATMALVLAVIVIARHKDNIIRLRTGAENKWEKKNDPS